MPLMCQVMDAPNIVHTTKNVEHNLWVVYQEDVQLCLNGGVSRGWVVINKATPSRLITPSPAYYLEDTLIILTIPSPLHTSNRTLHAAC